MMNNPIIAEITRGGIVESRHTGAFVVSDASGTIMAQAGDVSRPIFPRSAIKAFQCLPLVESGAADHFGLNDEEIALCCASHNGEADHVRVARSILAKIGLDETCYECGAHWPTHRAAAYELVRTGQGSGAVHNNCSGKHAGMLALAKYLNAPLTDYVKSVHPVQKKIAASLAQYCDVDIANAPMGIDGCSVPTWAMPLKNLALGFAKFNNGRILNAVKTNPFMVAGSGKFDTEMMQAVPRLFIKYGAEGVYCGTIAHAGLGFAMKCDDGAARAVEVAIAGALSKLEVWTDEEKHALNGFAQEDMSNWRKIPVGQIRVAF